MTLFLSWYIFGVINIIVAIILINIADDSEVYLNLGDLFIGLFAGLMGWFTVFALIYGLGRWLGNTQIFYIPLIKRKKK